MQPLEGAAFLTHLKKQLRTTVLKNQLENEDIRIMVESLIMGNL